MFANVDDRDLYLDGTANDGLIPPTREGVGEETEVDPDTAMTVPEFEDTDLLGTREDAGSSARTVADIDGDAEGGDTHGEDGGEARRMAQLDLDDDDPAGREVLPPTHGMEDDLPPLREEIGAADDEDSLLAGTAPAGHDPEPPGTAEMTWRSGGDRTATRTDTPGAWTPATGTGATGTGATGTGATGIGATGIGATETEAAVDEASIISSIKALLQKDEPIGRPDGAKKGGATTAGATTAGVGDATGDGLDDPLDDPLDPNSNSPLESALARFHVSSEDDSDWGEQDDDGSDRRR
jgi:hypothetical protein